MDALKLIIEPIRKATLGYFKYKINGHLYEGPLLLEDNPDSDGKYRFRISNEKTIQWEFFGLTDLKNLEKITFKEGEELKKSYFPLKNK